MSYIKQQRDQKIISEIIYCDKPRWSANLVLTCCIFDLSVRGLDNAVS